MMASNSPLDDEFISDDVDGAKDRRTKSELPEWVLAREGIKLIINNRIDEAERIFSRNPDSIVMLAGHSFAVMMDAIMSYEEEKLSGALLSLREIERRCATESGWFKQVSQKIFGNGVDIKPAKTLVDQLEMQIIMADSQVCIAILTFLRQDISGYFKSGWVLRKAWKVYQKVYKEISILYEKNVGKLNLPAGSDHELAPLDSSQEERQRNSPLMPERDEPESSSDGYTKLMLPNSKSDHLYVPSNNNRSVVTSKNVRASHSNEKCHLTRFGFLKKSLSMHSALSEYANDGSWRNDDTSFFHLSFLNKKDIVENEKIDKEVIIRLMGAVSFGYGLFQLGISLLPPSLTKLINILGFAADRRNGIACLMYARLGSDMRAPLATLSLLWFHTIVRPFYAIDGTNVQVGADASTRLLEESEAEFGQSSLFLFFRGRVCRLNSDTKGALKHYETSVENSNQRELKVLCMHEIGWCHLIELDYVSAQNTFLYLKSSSRWSKAFYCYLAGICAGSSHNFLHFCLVEDMVSLMKNIPKGTQLEEFLIKRYESCLADVEKARAKRRIFWRLLVFEMLYLWNALPSCHSSRIDAILRDCSEISDSDEDEPMRGMSSLISGCCYGLQKRYDEAVTSFRTCLDVRRKLAPNCMDAHISAFCQYELGALLLKNEQTMEEDVQFQLLKRFSGSGFPTKLAQSGDDIRDDSFPSEHHLIIMDLACENGKAIFQEVKQSDTAPSRWIFWGNQDESITMSLLNQLYFKIDSRVFLISKKSESYRIKSIYKLEENSESFMENDVANWGPRRIGFTSFNGLSGPRNRTNLMGLTVKVSYVITNNDSLNHLEDYRDKHIDSISKLCWILIHHLMTMVNATPTAVFRTTWGYRNASTNIFSGVIGDLQSGEAELGGTASFFTVDRIDVVDFVAPSVPTFMRFIFRAPPLSYTTNIFTLPFETWVWYCSFILIAVVLLVVHLIVMWEWKDPIFREYIEEKHGNMTPLRPGFSNVFLMEIGAVTQQGTESEPKSIAGRIATIFTFIALMFLYTSYSANIVALLQSTTESIRTLEDLLTSRISLGVEDIVYAHYYFENAQEPIRKSIYEQKIAPKGQKANFMSVREGIRRVQEGFFGFHAELSTSYKMVADTFQEHEKCGLKEISFVSLVEPWFPIKKNSALKEIFKFGLQKMYESGIQRREINRIYTKKPVCTSKGSNFGSAGLLDCYAAFLIFGIGIGCSLLLLLMEYLTKKYFEMYRR